VAEVPLLEAEKAFISRIDALARLGCFKPVYLLRDYIARGQAEKAKTLFAEVVGDLKKFSKDLAEISQEALKYRSLSRVPPSEALKMVESFLAMLKSKVFSSPGGVRLCIYIQPHLEVVYSNLSNMREELARGVKTGTQASIERVLKDLEVYMAYIARYTRDLLKVIEEL